MISLTLEEPAKSFLREIAFDRRRVSSLARDAKCLFVEVRAEDLDFRREVAACRLLEQKDANCVGLLTGSAARNPNPDLVGNFFSVKQVWDDSFGQYLEKPKDRERTL